jgi:hypothetical protein
MVKTSIRMKQPPGSLRLRREAGVVVGVWEQAGAGKRMQLRRKKTLSSHFDFTLQF